jgi:hypothetical protein
MKWSVTGERIKIEELGIIAAPGFAKPLASTVCTTVELIVLSHA